MEKSRRQILGALAASTSLAGCIRIEREKEPHEKYRKKDRSREYDDMERDTPDEDYGPEVVERDEAEELEPDNEIDIDEELEEDTTAERPEDSSECGTGYVETRLSIPRGETVYFEEPGPVEGGEHGREGRLTNEGDRVRVEYGPSVLYLDHRGETDYFTFGEEGLEEGGYGDYKGRYFSLHSNEEDKAEVVTGLVYDALGPDRREAIGVCIDQ